MSRCSWANPDNPLYVKYHDEEWGRPVFDDRQLFEMLILEGAQAGLSWETVLKKRERYRKVFDQFEVRKVSKYSDEKVRELLQDPGIIRNRLKIESAIQNARAFIEVQNEFGSFSEYIWGFVEGRPVVNNPKTVNDLPSRSDLSDKISRDLKKRGFKFVGTTIIYAYLQAVGIVQDHFVDCQSRLAKK